MTVYYLIEWIIFVPDLVPLILISSQVAELLCIIKSQSAINTQSIIDCYVSASTGFLTNLYISVLNTKIHWFIQSSAGLNCILTATCIISTFSLIKIRNCVVTRSIDDVNELKDVECMVKVKKGKEWLLTACLLIYSWKCIGTSSHFC